MVSIEALTIPILLVVLASARSVKVRSMTIIPSQLKYPDQHKPDRNVTPAPLAPNKSHTSASGAQ